MARPADTDVCVVGSGASGAVVAAELAALGHSVVILEGGPQTDRRNIPTVRDDWELRLRAYYPRQGRVPGVSYGDSCDPTYRVSRFRGVGGSTMHYEGFSTRLHPGDLRRESELGVGADWPLEFAELAACYDRVELMLGLSGTLDNPFDAPRGPYPNPPLAMSCAVQRMKTGCDALGLHAAHAPVAIISRPRDDRHACNFCGGCWTGCYMGAISNVSQTYLPVASRHGAELRVGCTATRLVTDATGRRIEGVEYLDQAGALQLQRARRVVLCGNAIETPRLLLMSTGPGHPDGLANRSGLVGRHYSAHTVVSVNGEFEQRVDAYKGPNINGMVQDFWDHDDGRGFAGGYVVALRNAELGPLYFYRRHVRHKRLFGEALYREMGRRFGHTANLSAYGEHFASADDRVELDTDQKDSHGLPLPRITVQRRDNERAMQEHMATMLTAIMEAAGGTTGSTSSGMLGTHHMGTCRMGTDARRSVTDPFGRSHDVEGLYIADGSLFPTSTPSNPTLTIQALATRVALAIAGVDPRTAPPLRT